MAEEQEKTRRCGWIALGLVVLLLPGVIPGSLAGAVAGMKSSDALFGRLPDVDLIRRLFALLGTIIGLLVTAALGMATTLAVSRLVAGSRERSARVTSREENSLEG